VRHGIPIRLRDEDAKTAHFQNELTTVQYGGQTEGENIKAESFELEEVNEDEKEATSTVTELNPEHYYARPA
jgi:hypothetical protein